MEPKGVKSNYFGEDLIFFLNLTHNIKTFAFMKLIFLFFFSFVAFAQPSSGDIVITGVFDAPGTSSGFTKGIELYVINDIADLSAYGVGSANNGGGTNGQEYTFPEIALSSGTYIYVTNQTDAFNTFFGFEPTFTYYLGLNGDDAVELFNDGVVIDTFGDINVDGNGQPWEYTDGWAYRTNISGPDGENFIISNWSFSGVDGLEGGSSNLSAAIPFPHGTYFCNTNNIFPEGFETSVPPPCWTTFNGDNGLGSVFWQANSSSLSGSQAAFINYDNLVDNSSVSEHWLVTPAFTPTENSSLLKFFQKRGEGTYYGSIYTVRVSSVSQTSQNDFEIIDTQGDDFGTSYSEHTVDLSLYINTPIYLAFVHENQWSNSWFIDDVNLINPVPLTNANFQNALNICLSTNPLDGMCNDNSYGPIPDWDVSLVTDMGGAFQNSQFNGDISQWNVSNVYDMNGMFLNSQFNGDLSQWDTSNVTQMNGMFRTSQFNGDLSQWDTSNVTDMNGMFRASQFNGDISQWDTSSVTNMKEMFDNSPFNGDLSQWDTSSVTNMRDMFNNSPFNGDLSQWDTSSVTNMNGIFLNSQFNGDISQWDVSNVYDMVGMFYLSQFNGDISQWDTSSVTNMSNIFTNSLFNGDLSQWDVSGVTNMSYMFDGSAFSTANYDALLNSWSQQNLQQNVNLGAAGVKFCNGGTARLSITDSYGWTISDSGLDLEAGCSTPLTDATIHTAVSNCLSTNPVDGMCSDNFYGSIPDWDVSLVTDMNGIFLNSQFNGDISQWDVSSVTNMNTMFTNSLFNGDISQWDVSGVTNMSYMFEGSAFNGDLSQWDVSSVTNMNTMFTNSLFNGDLSQWDVSSVTNMSNMFYLSQFNGDISQWNTSNVTDMSNMFYLSQFNGDISQWDTSNVTDMSYMFRGSQFNGDISQWNVSNVYDMNGMFLNSQFNGDISQWDVSSVTQMNGMFDGSALSTANYDVLLNSWSQQTLVQGVNLGASGVMYCDGAEARQSMIDNYGWIISDGGVDILICKKCLIVDDGDIYKGIDNDVSVSFYSNKPIRGFQFDISFPSGFIFNPSDISKLELPDSFVVTASNTSANNFRVVGFSLNSETIAAGTRPILNFPITIESTLLTGNYTVPITDLILSDTNNENITDYCDGDGVLTLYEDPTGDTTGDQIVNVIDILTTIDYIFGNNPDPFIFDFADVVSDGIINILDILGIQDIILAPDSRLNNSSQNEVTSSSAEVDNYLIVEDKQIFPDSSDTIEISLVNDDIVKGLQFDFSLPEGISLNANDISATSRLNGFILSAQEVSTNTFRVLVFSLSGASIDTGTGAIITLPITVGSGITDGVYPIALITVTISDINNIDISTTPADIGEVSVGTLGTTDLIKKDFKIYPNPTTGFINIQGNIGDDIESVIYNVLGEEVIKINNQNRIDVGRLENGIYILKVSDSTKTSVFKIVKK